MILLHATPSPIHPVNPFHLPGRVSGDEAGQNHCSRGTQQIRKVHLCQAAGEILPASERRDPTGRETTTKL